VNVPDPARGGTLLTLGTAGLLAVALVRTVVALPPWRVFDVDPLQAPGAMDGIGATGSLTLDLLLCLSAAAVLAGVHRRGGSIDPLLLLLWMLPLPWLWWHGRSDLEQAWRGGTLAAAWLGFIAAAHLRQAPGHRLLLAAGLLACVSPWLLRGAAQWFIEHPAMVAHYDAHRGEILAAFGWEPDGESARLYERRLRQREATGWFGLANVFSSLLAAAAVAWAALWLWGRGRHLGGGTVALAALFTVAAAAGVVLNGSKGAIAALLAGLLFLFMRMAVGWWRGVATAAPAIPDASSPPGSASRWVLLAVPIGLGAIVLRGVLPEGLLGERSLLFRWHYLVGASRVLGMVPLVGAGPAGFQEWYLLEKPPRSPEVVQSAHSVLVDHLLAVGLVGVAWIGLLLRTLWRSAVEPTAAAPLRGAAVAVVYLAACAAAFVAMATAAPASLRIEALWPWIGVGLFGPAALVARSILLALPASAVSWLLAAAAFTLLLHGQVEMTFFNQGSLPWALLLVGLAGAAGSGGRRMAWGAALPALPAVLGALLLAGPIRDAWSAERALRAAAAPLEALADGAGRSRRPPDARAVLEARRLAADRLAALAEAPSRAAAHAAALEIEQRLATALAVSDRAAAREAFMAAEAVCERALRRFGPSAKRLAERARVLRVWRHAHPDEVPADALVAALQQALARQPGDPRLWIDLGEAHHAAGDPAAARTAWRRALALDADLELDPLIQLPPAQRQRLLERIGPLE